MGRDVRMHRRLDVKRTIPGNAGDTREGHHQGQTRLAKHVRVSGVQNPAERSDVRVDVQSENEAKAVEMDPGRRGHTTGRVTNYVPIIFYTVGRVRVVPLS